MANEKEVQGKLDDIDLKLKAVQLKEAEMRLEITTNQVREYENSKIAKARQNAQRQTQMRGDHMKRAKGALTCTHRQGGQVGRGQKPYGKGPTALQMVLLPDEKSKLIMCSICRLRVFSPNPLDGLKKLRPGEGREQMQERVKKYLAFRKAFEELEELVQDKLTADAAAPMDCGVTFSLQDGEGRDIPVQRPCDKYAQGLDNRLPMAEVEVEEEVFA